MSPRTLTASRAPLRAVVPPPGGSDAWPRLLNFLYLHEQDELFRWCREVRAALPEETGATGCEQRRFRPVVIDGEKLTEEEA
jgi:hypothetical protein